MHNCSFSTCFKSLRSWQTYCTAIVIVSSAATKGNVFRIAPTEQVVSSALTLQMPNVSKC